MITTVLLNKTFYEARSEFGLCLFLAFSAAMQEANESGRMNRGNDPVLSGNDMVSFLSSGIKNITPAGEKISLGRKDEK